MIKNKILPILCIFILLSFIFINNNVFATEKTLIVDSYDMSDVYNYFSDEEAFYIAKVGSSYFILVPQTTGYRSYCAINSKNNCIAYYNSSWNSLEGNNYKFYKFDIDSLTFVYSWTGAHDSWTSTGCTVSYSSQGVYNSDHTTFFVNPPVLETPTVETVKIPKLETVEQIPEAMATALKVIIPVSLVLLSILLLIYLMQRLIYQSL